MGVESSRMNANNLHLTPVKTPKTKMVYDKHLKIKLCNNFVIKNYICVTVIFCYFSNTQQFNNRKVTRQIT